MNHTLEETEAEREEREALAKVQAWRARKALNGAPEIIGHVRSLIANAERGEVDPLQWAPMRLGATDDADAAYAQLIDWTMYWARFMTFLPPSTAVVAWRTREEHLGFRAGTTPEGAMLLTRVTTMWLLNHADQIDLHPAAAEYQVDVIGIVGALRGRYPMSARRPAPISLRPCPLCGEFAMGAEWLPEEPVDSEGLSDDEVEQLRLQRQLVNVVVRCEHCGHIVEAQASKLAKWLS